MGSKGCLTSAELPHQCGYRWKGGEGGFLMVYALPDKSTPGPTYASVIGTDWPEGRQAEKPGLSKQHRVPCHTHLSLITQSYRPAMVSVEREKQQEQQRYMVFGGNSPPRKSYFGPNMSQNWAFWGPFLEKYHHF